ncbi:Hcp family type VI secretion system effector [Ereboglobus luteus]|uniref:Type VI secretion system tube protein Hcp n=1 Tax=Ereboglobus luteus TaxID=1796921 RepID=A0A2U8E595_9BACT|nr:type VI secretion system tube protein Hcp [Ereboglobus luteus]AWI10033.1 hypothetical protein CKA38_12915 [Ereboglobus luteus]
MAFDAYLKFVTPYVVGEITLGDGYTPAKETNKSGWIDLEEYSFSATMAVSPARSSGTGAATTGKGKLEPFTFKKFVDATSMHLAFHASAGTVFEKIVVNLFASLTEGGSSHKPYQFLSIVMQGAVINSCKFSGGGGDELPTEELSIAYGAIEYEYKPFKVNEDTGAITPGAGGLTTVKWNTIKNTGTKS